MENLNRRGMFGKIGKLVVSTTLAGELGWSSKFFDPKYETEPGAIEDIKNTADEISKRISQQKEYFNIKISGRQMIASFNLNNMAEMLSYMAYLDGGYNRLSQLKKLCEEKKLLLGVEEADNDMYDAAIFYSSQKTEILIKFNPSVVGKYFRQLPQPDESVIRHEFYHVIQAARDPEFFSRMGFMKKVAVLGLTPAALGIFGYRVGYDVVRRRKFLRYVSASTLGVMSAATGPYIALNLNAFFNPIEQQALLQAGDYLPPLINPAIFAHLHGKLIDFKNA